MAKYINFEVTVPEVTRDDDWWIAREALLDALGWEHYPTNVTGEDIDAGNDSEEALQETIEVPSGELEVWDLLDELGVFDG